MASAASSQPWPNRCDQRLPIAEETGFSAPAEPRSPLTRSSENAHVKSWITVWTTNAVAVHSSEAMNWAMVGGIDSRWLIPTLLS